MKDTQNQNDKRGLRISEVGIKNLCIPLFFGKGKNKQLINASISMSVDLFSGLRGTHMSRFTQIAHKIKNKNIDEMLLTKTLKNIKKRLESDQAKISISFIYFLNKKAPLSRKYSSMNYKCKIECQLNNKNEIFNYYQVEVPIAILCPCSKEISRRGAHNQRAEVFLKIKSGTHIHLDELIKIIEEKASCELFSLLKRVDEKYVTEKMYNNPMFVEDIVREIGLWANGDKRVKDFVIKCRSFESIHNHNAYAIIIKDKINDDN